MPLPPTRALDRIMQMVVVNAQELLPTLVPEINFFTAGQKLTKDWKPELMKPKEAAKYVASFLTRPNVQTGKTTISSPVQQEKISVQRITARTGFTLSSVELTTGNVPVPVIHYHLSVLADSIRKQIHEIILNGENEAGLSSQKTAGSGILNKYVAAQTEIDRLNASVGRMVFLSSEAKWSLLKANSRITDGYRFVHIGPKRVTRGRWEAGRGNSTDGTLHKICKYGAQVRLCAGRSYASVADRARPENGTGGEDLLKEAVVDAFNDTLVYQKSQDTGAPTQEKLEKTKTACIRKSAIPGLITSGVLAYELEFQKQVKDFGVTDEFTQSRYLDFKQKAEHEKTKAIERNKVPATCDSGLLAIAYAIPLRMWGGISSDAAFAAAVKALLKANHLIDEATATEKAEAAKVAITSRLYPAVTAYPELKHYPYMRISRVKIPNIDEVHEGGIFKITLRMEGLGLSDNQINPGDFFEFEDLWAADTGGRLTSNNQKEILYKVVSVDGRMPDLLSSSYDVTIMPFDDPCGHEKAADRMFASHMRINIDATSTARNRNRIYGAVCAPTALLLLNLTKSNTVEATDLVTEMMVDINGMEFRVRQNYIQKNDEIQYNLFTEMGVAYLDPTALVVFSNPISSA